MYQHKLSHSARFACLAKMALSPLAKLGTLRKYRIFYDMQVHLRGGKTLSDEDFPTLSDERRERYEDFPRVNPKTDIPHT